MSNQGADVTVPVASDDPQWSRISEDEARAAAGDEAVEQLLAEVKAKGQASVERYRASGHSVVDQP